MNLFFTIMLLSLIISNAFNISKVVEIVTKALENCEEFQRYSESDTIKIIFDEKIKEIKDIQQYIFGDDLILSCLEYTEFMAIAQC